MKTALTACTAFTETQQNPVDFLLSAAPLTHTHRVHTHRPSADHSQVTTTLALDLCQEHEEKYSERGKLTLLFFPEELFVCVFLRFTVHTAEGHHP